MPTDIPKARELLEEVVKRLDGSENETDQFVLDKIESALGLMTRTVTKTPARTTARKITRDVVMETLGMLRQYPDKSNRWIGRQLGIDGGRVSEIRRGLRTPNRPGLGADGLNEVIREAMRGEDDEG